LIERVRSKRSHRVLLSSVKGSLIVLENHATVLVARVGVKWRKRLEEDTLPRLVFSLDE